MNQYKDNCRKYLGFYEQITVDRTGDTEVKTKIVIRIPDTDSSDKLKLHSKGINKVCLGIPLCYINNDVHKYYIVLKDDDKKTIKIYSISHSKVKGLKLGQSYAIETYADYLGPQYEIDIKEWKVELKIPIELCNDIFFIWNKNKPNNYSKWKKLLKI